MFCCLASMMCILCFLTWAAFFVYIFFSSCQFSIIIVNDNYMFLKHVSLCISKSNCMLFLKSIAYVLAFCMYIYLYLYLVHILRTKYESAKYQLAGIWLYSLNQFFSEISYLFIQTHLEARRQKRDSPITHR